MRRVEGHERGATSLLLLIGARRDRNVVDGSGRRRRHCRDAGLEALYPRSEGAAVPISLSDQRQLNG